MWGQEHFQDGELIRREETRGLARTKVAESSFCPQLQDSPRDSAKLIPSSAGRSTVSNISHLHENFVSSKSESLHSFDSISCKSESLYKRAVAPVMDILEEKPASVSRPVPLRRISCPSVITTNALIVSQESEAAVPHRRVMSLCSGEHVREMERSRMTSQIRRERIKHSLSKLSETIASLRPPPALDTSLEVSQMTGGRCEIIPKSPPDSLAKGVRSSHRRDSGCVIFDEELLPPPSSVGSDLLSPNSPIAPIVTNRTGTLRIYPPPAPVASPVFPPPLAPSPSSGNIMTLHASSAFAPSAAGKELMTVFNSTALQDSMWQALLQKGRGPLEYADSLNKMPCVLYCLRGLIRYGNGEHGVTKPDILPLLFHIMTGKHAVCETSAFVESAECSSCVLSMLAVNPVSRQNGVFSDLSSRPRFEPLMIAQNAILFQQIYGVLSQHVPRWTSLEAAHDNSLKLTSRGVSALLEILYVYCANARISAAWMTPAPDIFKLSLPTLIVNIAQRIPNTVSKCMHILDALLDQVPSCDSGTCRQLAQGIQCSLRLPMNHPQFVAEARSVINKWAPGNMQSNSSRRKHRGISAFFKTFTGKSSSSSSAQSVCNKTTIYIEYSRIATAN